MPDTPLTTPTSEDEARSEVSVAELVEQDLDDLATPSRRSAARAAADGGFDVPTQPRRTLAQRRAAGELGDDG